MYDILWVEFYYYTTALLLPSARNKKTSF